MKPNSTSTTAVDFGGHLGDFRQRSRVRFPLCVNAITFACVFWVCVLPCGQCGLPGVARLSDNKKREGDSDGGWSDDSVDVNACANGLVLALWSASVGFKSRKTQKVPAAHADIRWVLDQ